MANILFRGYAVEKKMTTRVFTSLFWYLGNFDISIESVDWGADFDIGERKACALNYSRIKIVYHRGSRMCFAVKQF